MTAARWSTWTDEDLAVGYQGAEDALCEATEDGIGSDAIIDLIASIVDEQVSRGTR